jgi:hypothetical protein
MLLKFYSVEVLTTCLVLGQTPIFSGFLPEGERLGLMFIAYVEHGEVYVPSSEKEFFAMGRLPRKIREKSLRFFV